MVEFAITLPILILLVFGGIDIGRVIYSSIVVTNAAREGAEYISYNPTETQQLTTVVTNEAENSGVSMDNFAVSYSNCCTVYKPVTVSVQACVSNIYVLNLLDSFSSCGSSGILISKSVSMMVLP